MALSIAIISAVIILLLYTVIVPYFTFRSVFKRNESESAQAKALSKKLSSRGAENPDEIIKEADNFFKNKRYRKTSIYANDETELYARLYTPAGGDAGKTVLLAHGIDSSANADFYKIFDFYFNHGFNVLLIHERAHGKSGGKYKTMGFAESYDILSWCQWLEMRFSTGCPIVIHGIDDGAYAAFCAAAMPALPANVRSLICENLYTAPADALKKRLGFFARISMPFIKLYYKSVVGFDLRGAGILRLARKIRIPVLIITSKTGPSISDEMIKKIAERTGAQTESASIEPAHYDIQKEKKIKKFIPR